MEMLDAGCRKRTIPGGAALGFNLSRLSTRPNLDSNLKKKRFDRKELVYFL
jgi:hypothetical protein